MAQALRLPNLSLTGSGGLISTDLDHLLEGKSAAYSIGPNLTGPIFDAGRGKARAQAAQARAQQARAAYDKAAKQAFLEAANSINAHVKTGEIVAAQTALVKSNNKVASVANDRFQADVRRDRLLSVVEAYRALGGGWK